MVLRGCGPRDVQAFEEEMALLPGCYSPPEGCVLLLQHQAGPCRAAVAVGCVAVRPLHTNHSAKATSGSTPAMTTRRSPDYGPQQQQQQDAVGTMLQPLQQRQQQEAVLQKQQTQQLQLELTPQPMSSSPGSSQQAAAAAHADISSMCEMKRLWVTQDHKGQGLGRALAEAAVVAAQQIGYRHIVLDTLESLTAANRLYEGLGFVRRAAYYNNPLPGVVYWQLQLS
jgi:ribosomal protein S18 acetylase RimI-like enzyme